MKTSLSKLVDRIKTHQKMMQVNPENSELLEKCMKKDAELILRCVVENASNPILKEIFLN